MNNSIAVGNCQEENEDLLKVFDYATLCDGDKRWGRYKMTNSYLSLAYSFFDLKKSERLNKCCKYLFFDVDEQQKKSLSYAAACHVRLCPLCSWRRSLKAYYNTMRIVNYINENYGYAYLFMTLTVKNCKADELSDTIDLLFSAVQRLFQRKELKKVVHGCVRTIEVTHNIDSKSSSFDTYHPHLHILCAVNKSYFSSRDYISKKKLEKLWRDCLRVDYVTQVDIKKCYDTASHAVAECSKYATKTSDILVLDDFDLTIEAVKTLDVALANRRLLNYSGIFREIHRLLKLDDEETGDLIHISDDEKTKDVVLKEVYAWYLSHKNYFKIFEIKNE